MKKQKKGLGIISRDKISESVIKAVESVLEGHNKVSESKHFVDDLGADSLDQIEIVCAVEKALDFDIMDEDIDRLKDMTVGQFIDFLYINY